MKFNPTQLPGVILVAPDVFEDRRGYYVEIYNEELYRRHGIDVRFVQDDISVSRRNVLRGIHGDMETCKLISCLWGEFFLVVLDGRPESPHFGKWQTFTLSAANRLQVYVPAGYGNGHYAISEMTVFHYKQTTYYQPEKQFTYKWNDPRFNIPWPCDHPIVSERDA